MAFPAPRPILSLAVLLSAGVLLVGSAEAKGAVSLSPQLTMNSLGKATAELSPTFSALYFTPQSPAYYFVQHNLESHTLQQFTLFFPTDAALARYNSSLGSLPANCPAVPVRNHLAQQLLPARYTADQLAALYQLQLPNRLTGARKNLLKTMSPVALSVLKKSPLVVGLLNNGYNRVISNATVVVPNAVITRSYVLHLIDNILSTCI